MRRSLGSGGAVGQTMIEHSVSSFGLTSKAPLAPEQSGDAGGQVVAADLRGSAVTLRQVRRRPRDLQRRPRALVPEPVDNGLAVAFWPDVLALRDGHESSGPDHSRELP